MLYASQSDAFDAKMSPLSGLLHHLRNVVPLLLERFVLFVDLEDWLAVPNIEMGCNLL